MRIAQVSPLFESVPPKLYGGTERIVFNLSESLVKLGHEVTLFASGDSLTSAELVPVGREALRLAGVKEPLAAHLLMFEKVLERASEFDIVHFHTEIMHFVSARRMTTPTVSTFHGRLDFPEYEDLFDEYAELPMTSISMSQRRALPRANWISTIHHGLDPKRIGFDAKGGEDLVFLGRISPEKGLEDAIEIARRSGRRLRIAAKIEKADWDYYQKVKPLLDEPFIEYVGEINDRQKTEFLGSAKATLFPICWPEPFGLVMIESFAAGTPVVAFRCGSVPEIIRDGRTGYIVDDVAGAVKAIAAIDSIDRAVCREEFDGRFTSERMASDYVAAYEKILAAERNAIEFRRPSPRTLPILETTFGGRA